MRLPRVDAAADEAVQASTNVTHDAQPPERPSGPTPEEISARLEALLKRTHALRQAQAAADAAMPHDGPAWPPHEADLDAVEVMDAPVARVAIRDGRPAVGADAPPPTTPSRPHATGVDSDSDATAPASGQQDWTTLRLRDMAAEPSGTPTWVWLALAGLVIALGVESAYLLRTAPWARDAATAAPVALRIEGSPLLRVRVNSENARTLPLERTVDGGPLVLEVEIAEAAPAAAPDGAASSTPPAAPGATAGLAVPGAGNRAVAGATTGTVRIESTPSGAIVTMGGRERGPTPLTIAGLRPGRHDVLVVGEGWRRALKVDVTAGQTARLLASGPAQP